MFIVRHVMAWHGMGHGRGHVGGFMTYIRVVCDFPFPFSSLLLSSSSSSLRSSYISRFLKPVVACLANESKEKKDHEELEEG